MWNSQVASQPISETVFLLDLSIRYTRPAWSVYLSGSNLLDREYVDRGNVIQPGPGSREESRWTWFADDHRLIL